MAAQVTEDVRTHLPGAPSVGLGVIASSLHGPAHTRVEHRTHGRSRQGRQARGQRDHPVGIVANGDRPGHVLTFLTLFPSCWVRERLSLPNELADVVQRHPRSLAQRLAKKHAGALHIRKARQRLGEKCGHIHADAAPTHLGGEVKSELTER